MACVKGTNSKPINLGCGYGIKIKELVETMQRIHPFDAYFDHKRPSGFPKRVMDMSYAKKCINFNPIYTLEEGLRETWNWFIKNQNEYEKKQNYFN